MLLWVKPIGHPSPLFLFLLVSFWLCLGSNLSLMIRLWGSRCTVDCSLLSLSHFKVSVHKNLLFSTARKVITMHYVYSYYDRFCFRYDCFALSMALHCYFNSTALKGFASIATQLFLIVTELNCIDWTALNWTVLHWLLLNWTESNCYCYCWPVD